jgi:hypothetical protein
MEFLFLVLVKMGLLARNSPTTPPKITNIQFYQRATVSMNLTLYFIICLASQKLGLREADSCLRNHH